MDLVEEQDGAHIALTESDLCRGHQLPDVLHTGVDRREFRELLGGNPSNQPGQCGLARPRWTPQHDRRQPVSLD